METALSGGRVGHVSVSAAVGCTAAADVQRGGAAPAPGRSVDGEAAIAVDSDIEGRALSRGDGSCMAGNRGAPHRFAGSAIPHRRSNAVPLLLLVLLLVGPASANESRMAPASAPLQLTKLEAETVTFAWELPAPLLPLNGGRGCCRLTTNAVLLQPEKLSPCTVTELVFAENERAVPEPAVQSSRGKAVLVESEEAIKLTLPGPENSTICCREYSPGARVMRTVSALPSRDARCAASSRDAASLTLKTIATVSEVGGTAMTLTPARRRKDASTSCRPTRSSIGVS